MTKRMELRMRFSLGLRPQQQWRVKDMLRKTQVTRELAVSYAAVCQRSFVVIPRKMELVQR